MAPAAERRYNGVLYHSKAEANYAKRLDLLKKAGKIGEWERQRAYKLVVGGDMIGKYVADFAIWLPGEEDLSYLEEIKGRETPEWRLKEKLFRALYPDIPLKVLDTKGRVIRGAR